MTWGTTDLAGLPHQRCQHLAELRVVNLQVADDAVAHCVWL